ncbi:MAG: phosphate ABC transporter permease PstA [Cyanobacteria bacterium P01_A01_bin.123]
MRLQFSRRWFNTAMTALVAVLTLISLLPLGSILGYLAIRGFRRLDWAALTQLPPAPGVTGGGIGNAILGTLLVVGLATAIAVPLSVLAGLYIAEFCPHSGLQRSIRFATNVLSGVPAIMAGVFAYGLLVVTGILGFSAVAGALALAVLMLPIMVRTTDAALQFVSPDLRWAAASIGLSPTQTALRLVLPAALPGIVTGILLAIARAAGETAPLLFTALNSSFFPTGLFDPTPTLSVLIYNFAIAPFESQQELAWVGALILVLLIFITSLLARWATRPKY